MTDQLDPDAFFYFYLTASGGIAFASGYAAGVRLNVGALLIICLVSGIAVFLAGLGLGLSGFAGIVSAIVAIVSLQLGYFSAMLTRRGTSRAASSDDCAVEAEEQGTISPGERGSR